MHAHFSWAWLRPTCSAPTALLGAALLGAGVGAELAAGGRRGRRQGSHTPGEGPLLAERETGQVSIKALRVTTSLGFLPFPPPAS